MKWLLKLPLMKLNALFFTINIFTKVILRILGILLFDLCRAKQASASLSCCWICSPSLGAFPSSFLKAAWHWRAFCPSYIKNLWFWGGQIQTLVIQVLSWHFSVCFAVCEMRLRSWGDGAAIPKCGSKEGELDGHWLLLQPHTLQGLRTALNPAQAPLCLGKTRILQPAGLGQEQCNHHCCDEARVKKYKYTVMY